jgi:hypothetical protein
MDIWKLTRRDGQRNVLYVSVVTSKDCHWVGVESPVEAFRDVNIKRIARVERNEQTCLSPTTACMVQ